jgi:hypothetical protein
MSDNTHTKNRTLYHSLYARIYHEIHEFSRSCIMIVRSYPRLMYFFALLIFLYTMQTMSGLNEFLLRPLINQDFLHEALTFSLGYGQDLLIILMLFAQFAVVTVIMICNSGLSVYTNSCIHNTNLSLYKAIKHGIHTTFNMLYVVIFFTLMYIIIEKIGCAWDMKTYEYNIYLILKVIFFTAMTYATWYAPLVKYKPYATINKMYRGLIDSYMSIIGISCLFILLSTASYIGKMMSYIPKHILLVNVLYDIVSFILFIPIVIFIMMSSFIMPLITIHITRRYLDI